MLNKRESIGGMEWLGTVGFEIAGPKLRNSNRKHESH